MEREGRGHIGLRRENIQCIVYNIYIFVVTLNIIYYCIGQPVRYQIILYKFPHIYDIVLTGVYVVARKRSIALHILLGKIILDQNDVYIIK